MYNKKNYSAKLIIFSILLFLFLIITTSSFSQTSPKLVIDGKTINSSPGPVIEQGRTLVPIRIISEELGATVNWDEINRTVLIELGDKSAVLKIDSLIFEVGKGSNNFDTSDVPAKIISDRTFVPLRLVSNVLGAGIGWDDSSRTVTIDSSKKVSYSPYSDFFRGKYTRANYPDIGFKKWLPRKCHRSQILPPGYHNKKRCYDCPRTKPRR